MEMPIFIRDEIIYTCTRHGPQAIRDVLVKLVNMFIPRACTADIESILPFAPNPVMRMNRIIQRNLPDNQYINICDCDGNTVLHYACIYGTPDIISYVLACGANPLAADRFGRIALMYAVENNTIESQSAIIQERGSVCVQYLDIKGRTALFYARTTASVRLLRSYGAVVNEVDLSGRTPFHMAVQHGCIEVMDELVRAHADPTALDNKHRSALHMAVAYPEIIQELIDIYGLDVNAKDNDGKTPLYEARHGGYTVTIAMLRATT
jgi:ankyrin repeat protein